MKTFAALIALSGVLSGCDVAINEGINLGTQVIGDVISGAIRSNAQPD